MRNPLRTLRCRPMRLWGRPFGYGAVCVVGLALLSTMLVRLPSASVDIALPTTSSVLHGEPLPEQAARIPIPNAYSDSGDPDSKVKVADPDEGTSADDRVPDDNGSVEANDNAMIERSQIREPAAPVRARGVWQGVAAVDAPNTCDDLQLLQSTWHYNWKTTSPCPSGFVPMIWGDWCNGNGECDAQLPEIASSSSGVLLGFNEPDSPTQSNMTVERAVQLWPALESTGLRLASPAVSSNAAGFAWFQRFMEQAQSQGLRVDVIAAHWYGDCANTQGLVSYLRELRAYGRPIWLTEFSCWYGSGATNARFIAEALPALASLEFVERIAWFTNRPYPDGYEGTSLIGANGKLTATGDAFVSFR